MKIKENLTGKAHEKGYAIANTHGAALIWMSAGNSYFKEEIIEKLLTFCSGQFSKIFIMAPENPAEHTYQGIGYTQAKARKKAQLNANLLMNRARRTYKKLNNKHIFLKDWSDHIEHNQLYQTALNEIQQLYNNSEKFRKDVHDTTLPVIKQKLKPHIKLNDALKEAANYLLEELAFILVAHKIFKVKELTYVYHKDWKIYRKFVAGNYDGKPKKHLGFIIINDATEHTT